MLLLKIPLLVDLSTKFSKELDFLKEMKILLLLIFEKDLRYPGFMERTALV